MADRYCVMGHEQRDDACDCCTAADDLRIPLAAISSICPRHTPLTPPAFDLDCGDCGSRQTAAGIHLVGLCDDLLESLDRHA